MSSKTLITLISTLPNTILEETEGVLREHLPGRFCLRIKSVMLSEVVENRSMAPSGIAPESLWEHCEKFKQEGSLVVFLVHLPVCGENRIFKSPDERGVIVSTWGMTRGKLERKYAALVVGAALSCYFNIGHSSYKEFCILGTSQYYEKFPFDFCHSCKSSFDEYASIVNRSIKSIEIGETKSPHFVIIQHGIRTRARWYRSVIRGFRRNHLPYFGFRYGYFNFIKFFFNKRYGREPKNVFYEKYLETRELYPHAVVSVVAHSYGTLLLAQSIDEFKDIKLDRVILVNGVIPSKYDWERHIADGRIQRVLSERGGTDVFPVLAKKFIPGAGDSDFPDSAHIMNGYYDGSNHYALLTMDHCEQVWIPFILDDQYSLPTEADGGQPSRLVRAVELLPDNKIFSIGIVFAIIVVLIRLL